VVQVQNVDFSRLSDNTLLSDALVDTIKSAIVEEVNADLTNSDIDVALYAGSVMVHAKISLSTELQDAGLTSGQIATTLETVGPKLTNDVKLLNGIADAQEGEITVAVVQVGTEYPINTEKSGDILLDQANTETPKWMQLQNTKEREYNDGGDSEGEDVVTVRRSSFMLFVGVLCGAVALLSLALCLLGWKVLHQRHKLRERVPVDMNGNLTAIGRPIVAGGNAASGAVVGGIPVTEERPADGDVQKSQDNAIIADSC